MSGAMQRKPRAAKQRSSWSTLCESSGQPWPAAFSAARVDRRVGWTAAVPDLCGRGRITVYLKDGSALEKAVPMANHALTRTTQLYDRRRDEVNLDEVERIGI